MRSRIRSSRAGAGRPARVAAGVLAATLAATVLYAHPGGDEASAADLALVAGALAQAGALPATLPGAPVAGTRPAVTPADPAAPAVSAAASSADYFLKIDGIAGESQDRAHAGAIEVLSWSLGASNPTTIGSGGGGAGAGKVSFSDLSVMVDQSKASPLLMLAVATGQHIKSVVLTGRRAGGGAGGGAGDYLTVTLSDVLVTSIQTSAGSETPTESLSLAFSKIVVSYKPQLQDGRLGSAVTAGWDLKAAKKV